MVVLGEVKGGELAGAKSVIEKHVKNGRLEERTLVHLVAKLDPLFAGPFEAHDLDVGEAAPVWRVDDEVFHAGQGIPSEQWSLLVDLPAEMANGSHGCG